MFLLSWLISWPEEKLKCKMLAIDLNKFNKLLMIRLCAFLFLNKMDLNHFSTHNIDHIPLHISYIQYLYLFYKWKMIIWKVMGSTPVGGLENSFVEYFDLRTLLHYLHFIQVANPFIINETCLIFAGSSAGGRGKETHRSHCRQEELCEWFTCCWINFTLTSNK